MTVRPRFRHTRRALLALAAATTLAAAGLLAGGGTPPRAATQEPCDIYASAGTPCVAAHSTVRALYGAYDGELYQVKRASDSTTKDIYLLSHRRVRRRGDARLVLRRTTARSPTSTTSPARATTSRRARGRGASGPDNQANATASQTTASGHRSTASTFRLAWATGTTRPEHRDRRPAGDGVLVFDGAHYNSGCCFDYGNAETNNHDDGNGTMEAVYFGNETVWGTAGNGPWVMADLENGLFAGGTPAKRQRPTDELQVHHRDGHGRGTLGDQRRQRAVGHPDHRLRRPAPHRGYNPMKKQGAIILGIGGDNSDGAAGTFYEGVMTTATSPTHERRPGQHRLRRLRELQPVWQPVHQRREGLAEGHHALLHE